MFRFIHTADIHLDSPLKGLETHEDAPVEEIRGATRRAFENLIDLALEESVDFILIAGDLYDGDWKDYNTGLFFIRQMGRLDKAGIRVFIVSGNHDAASQITRTMPLPENVTLFSHKAPQSVKLEAFKVLIHGQSYASRAETENLSLKYPRHDPDYFNIGLLHTALTGREGHADYAPCTMDDLMSKAYDYWALGHIHQREVVSEDPWIVFPGNLQGRHIKETAAKGATLVTVEDRRIIHLDARELDVLRWAICRVDVSKCKNSAHIHEKVKQAFKKEQDAADGKPLALRLILTGKSDMHMTLFDKSAQWLEEFRGIAAAMGNIWLETLKLQTQGKTGNEDLADDYTPVSGLIRSIQALDMDNAHIKALVPEIDSLEKKLPPEIFNDPAFPDILSGKTAELRTEVRELLLSRLHTKEHTQ